MTIFEEEFPVDCLHSTGRRQFLYSLLALFLLARGKASVAKAPARDLFYVLNLKTGQLTVPKDHFIASGQPGSLLKLVLAAAFCQGRLPACHQTIICNGTIIIDGTRYSCRIPHGKLNLPLALGHSCNVFFASVIGQLHPSGLANALEKFGLTAAAKTALAHRDFRDSQYIDFSLGLTKEIEVNALEVLNIVALIATRGEINASCTASLNSPHLQNAPHGPHFRAGKNAHFEPETWAVLQEGMALASRRGTARNLDIHNKLHLAVKTGTSQHGHDFKSWLAGYFPAETPKFAFCLRAETGTSYDAAVPMARRLLFRRNWS